MPLISKQIPAPELDISTLGLRRKTQIITGRVLLGLLAVLYAVTRRTLLVQFSEPPQLSRHV